MWIELDAGRSIDTRSLVSVKIEPSIRNDKFSVMGVQQGTGSGHYTGVVLKTFTSYVEAVEFNNRVADGIARDRMQDYWAAAAMAKDVSGKSKIDRAFIEKQTDLLAKAVSERLKGANWQ